MQKSDRWNLAPQMTASKSQKRSGSKLRRKSTYNALLSRLYDESKVIEFKKMVAV